MHQALKREEKANSKDKKNRFGNLPKKEYRRNYMDSKEEFVHSSMNPWQILSREKSFLRHQIPGLYSAHHQELSQNKYCYYRGRTLLPVNRPEREYIL